MDIEGPAATEPDRHRPLCREHCRCRSSV